MFAVRRFCNTRLAIAMLTLLAWNSIAGLAFATITVTAEPSSFVICKGKSISSTLSGKDDSPPGSGTPTWKFEADAPCSVVGTMLSGTFNDAGKFSIEVRGYVSYNGGTTWIGPGKTTITVLSVEVTMSPDPVFVAVGGTASLTATVVPAEASTYVVVVASADPSLATVGGTCPNLTVTGVSKGTTQIQAKVNGEICASVTCHVVWVTYTSGYFLCNPFALWVGNSESLTANVVPVAAQGAVTFETNSTSVATVSGSAPSLTVTGVSVGETQVVGYVDDDPCGSCDVAVAEVTFSPDPLYVGKDDTGELTATVNPDSAKGSVTFASEDTNIATVAGAAPTLTVTGKEAGKTNIKAVINGKDGPKKAEVIVFKVEITDDAGAVLAVLVASEFVAIQTKLKAKVTPAGIVGLTYQWTVGGTHCMTYEHDVDEAAKHKVIALAGADLQKDNVAFYWQAVGNPITVKCKATKGAAKHEATGNFNVTNKPDPNKEIYAKFGASEKYNPNGVGKFYDVLVSHASWHGGANLDNGDVPVFSDSEGGGAKTWGDGGMTTTAYNGRAFLKWHRAFIDSHLAWRGTFNQGAIGGAAPGAPAVPDYLTATPPNASAEVSVTYQYVRLGEYQNLYQLGRDVVHPWHNNGHGLIAAASGDGVMGTHQSPNTKDNIFWRWHTTVDTMDTAIDKATPTVTPANAGNAPVGTTKILVVFDKRVSSGGGATNTLKITAGALTVNGNAATAIADVGGVGSKFMAYEFTFPAQPAGAHNCVLTGTASFAGKTWMFTTP